MMYVILKKQCYFENCIFLNISEFAQQCGIDYFYVKLKIILSREHRETCGFQVLFFMTFYLGLQHYALWLVFWNINHDVSGSNPVQNINFCGIGIQKLRKMFVEKERLCL